MISQLITVIYNMADPIFIFALRLQITGAAMATMLSNLAATLYFIRLLYKRRDSSVIAFDPRYYTWGQGIPLEILLVGFSSAVMNLLAIFSNIVLNRLMGSYSSAAIAGMGIAKKIDLLAFAIAIGMAQGVLPLAGYTYAAKNFARMRAAIKTTFVYSLLVTTLGTIFLITCAAPVARFFIDDAETVAYGQYFLRVICLSCPSLSVTMMVITLFQATGKKVQPMILSLLRKGGLDIPFMFLMNALVGVKGIAWANPMADVLAMTVAVCLFVSFWRKLQEQITQQNAFA